MFRGKRIISGIMLVLMLVSFIGCKKTSKAATFTYEENAAGNIVITGLTDKGRADAKVIVPAKIDGKKVDGIGSGVFRDDTTVTDVVISDGISYIAENVFLSCYNLKTIEIPESVNSIGTNAFTDTQWEYASKRRHDRRGHHEQPLCSAPGTFTFLFPFGLLEQPVHLLLKFFRRMEGRVHLFQTRHGG